MIYRRPAALHALAEQALWIAERSPEQAELFFQAVDATLRSLDENPLSGKLFAVRSRRLKGLRYARVGKFRNHLVFYFLVRDGIEWVHLLHAARDLARALRQDVK